MFNNVTTVRGYAVYLGLDPTDRSVLRKIQRQCERGEFSAELVEGTWLIKVPQNVEGAITLKNWESVQDVYFEGMTLYHAGYGNDKNYGLNNNKVSLFYVNQGPNNKPKNHYAVTWDFNEFLDSENNGTFEWPSPHSYILIKEKERKQSIVDYYRSTKFIPYGKEVEFMGRTLTIINRPIEFSRPVGEYHYIAGATDNEGNVYQVFWNMFNMFEPSEIELTVDNSRYCKHCLTRWSSNTDDSPCKHEWVDDLG